MMHMCFVLGAGVCVRLKEWVEQLFPVRTAERRKEIEEEKAAGEPLLCALAATDMMGQPQVCSS